MTGITVAVLSSFLSFIVYYYDFMSVVFSIVLSGQTIIGDMR